MVLEINESFTTVMMVVDENGNPTSGKTISYRLFDESMNLQESGSMTELGVYGIYYKSWTPDTAGYWIFEAYYTGTDFKFYDIKMYPVEKGEEKDVEARIGNPLSDTLNSLTAKMGNLSVPLSTILQTFTVNESGNLAARVGFLQQFIAKGTGTVLPSNKSLYDVIALDRLDHSTYGLSALKTLIDALNVDLGNFSAQTNLQSLLAALGIPDVAGKSLYTVLITDRLDNATFGLNALDVDLNAIITAIGTPASSLAADIAAIQTDLGDFSGRTYLKSLLLLLGWADVLNVQTLEQRLGFQTSGSIESVIAALENKLKASPTVTSILLNVTGGTAAICPSGKSIWDVLGDATISMSTLNTALTVLEDKLKATPSVTSILANGTGFAIAPTNKSIWDALGNPTGDTLTSLTAKLGNPAASLGATLEHGTYGLSALQALLANGTYGLSALDTQIDAIIAYVDELESRLTSSRAGYLDYLTKLDNYIQVSSTLTGTPTPNFFDTNLTEATDDHYNGMIIIFTSGNLAGQASIIADYNGTTKEITVDPAFIETPASGNAFVIVSSAVGKLGTKSKGMDQIYDLIDQLFTMKRLGDTVTTDGTEQTIFIIDNPDFPFKPTGLLIDTTNHTVTETTVLRVYLRLKSGGNYVEFDEITLIGVQDPLGVSFDLYPNLYGIKVTIEKTAGTNRAYDYEIYFEER